MSDLTKQAHSAVEMLLKADEDQLFEQIGIRAKAIAEDPLKGSSFEPQVTYNQAQMGAKEDVLEFGKRLFFRWNQEAYRLICGSEPADEQDRKDLIDAFGVSDVAVAAALSTLLVTHLGLAPAIAAVVASLIIKRFFRPVHENFCQLWKKNLSNGGEEGNDG